MNMKILFIGSYVPDQLPMEYKKYISIAGNKFQKSFIDNYTLFEKDIDILSYIPYPRFPVGKKILVNEKTLKNINFIKNINIPVLKEISIWINCLRFLFKNSNKYDVILVYNLFTSYLKPAIIIRNIHKFKVGSIIADMYIDEYKYESFFKKIRKRINLKKELNLLGNLDFCIPITKQIVEDFEFEKPYIVLEGGINLESLIEDNKKITNNKKRIVYTGSIDSVNGIEILIKVAKLIDPLKYEFIIAGDGPLFIELKNELKNNKNIKILGRISNEEAIGLQRQADLLILTRPVEQKITRYTFPSKLHEYMNSEVPVLITKLPGIGNEYYDFINIIEKNEPYTIIKNIEEIFGNYKYYKNKAIKGKEYLIKNKTWNKQTKKVIEFISEFCYKE